jgi:hypothetical protein
VGNDEKPRAAAGRGTQEIMYIDDRRAVRLPKSDATRAAGAARKAGGGACSEEPDQANRRHWTRKGWMLSEWTTSFRPARADTKNFWRGTRHEETGPKW